MPPTPTLKAAKARFEIYRRREIDLQKYRMKLVPRSRRWLGMSLREIYAAVVGVGPVSRHRARSAR